jgi:hypothetical protein
MDLHQVRWALLKISVVVLAAVSWVFCSFVFASRPTETEASQSAGALTSLVRLPASLPAELPTKMFKKAPKVQEPIRMDVVQLPCWEAKDLTTPSKGSRWVRLIGRLCQNADAEVTVRNLSNGYLATVFEARPGVLTTDFIPLENGSNEIQIRWMQESGAYSENKVLLTR